MRALVTGAAGFVGSTLSARLLADGHEVVGIDSLTDYYDVSLKRSNLEQLSSSKFTLLEKDISLVDLASEVGEVDWVFHQAGQPGVRRSWGNEFQVYTHANIQATQKLLEWAKGNSRLQKFVYASSSSVYGNAEAYPTHEDNRPQPLSPYGVTKLAAEHLCSLYAANFEVPTVSLRYFTVYGPRQRPDMAFTRFVKAAITGGMIEIYGDGKQVRDFTFVEDVVEANIRAASLPTSKGAIFNVAGGSNVTVNEVLDLISQISGNRLDVRYVESVAGDVRKTSGSINRISKDLGWQPLVSLEEGLLRHLSWGRENFG